MIFWGEYHNNVNKIWSVMIRLRRVKTYLPLATLHENKRLTLDWSHVPPNRVTSTKYHSVLVTNRVDIRNKGLILLIPGSNPLQGEFHFIKVSNIKSILMDIHSMKKILCLIEIVAGEEQELLQP